MESADFEAALAALSEGYSEGIYEGTAIWCEPSRNRRWTTQQSVCSASTPRDPHPMAPGEWNGNHNDRAFPMVGVPA
ncbi:hypothetical protein SAMN05519103_08869 [Rhizobiales bacterium GAS113]|nr:hypothetical protein SAMN05519103_08869 [Rhizobiales bacterium GAS113]